MKFVWEQIYDRDFDETWRAKVVGGWIVKNVYRTSQAHNSTMVFVEDKKHAWSTEENVFIDILIDDFEVDHNWFSVRTLTCLKSEGILTVNDLLSWCEHQLYLTPNLGKKSMCEINELLSMANLKINSNPHKSFGEYKSKCRDCIANESIM